MMVTDPKKPAPDKTPADVIPIPQSQGESPSPFPFSPPSLSPQPSKAEIGRVIKVKRHQLNRMMEGIAQHTQAIQDLTVMAEILKVEIKELQEKEEKEK